MKSDYSKLTSRTTLAISLLLLTVTLLAGCGGSQEEQGSQGEQSSQKEETTTAPSGQSTNARKDLVVSAGEEAYRRY
jgi:uncharacterized lipoprotein